MMAEMERCRLGQTGVAVPVMGAGTMLWMPGKRVSEADLYDTYSACLDHGLNFFDTAEIYGNGVSEGMLGKCRKRDGREALIATKFAPPSPMNPLKQRRKTVTADSPRALLEALDGSLSRLGVDAIDLYQVHMPPRRGIPDYMDAMAEAVRAGKVRAVGVCNFSEKQIREAHAALAAHGIPLATAMVGYNILRRYPETNGVFAACKALGISVIPYAPLAEGTLTGKYRSGRAKVPLSYRIPAYFGHLGVTGERNDGVPFVKRLFSKPREVDIAGMEPLMRVLDDIARARGKTIAQVALNWLLAAEDVHILPIPGTKSIRQAADNAGAAGWRLAPGERARISDAEAKSRG